jgi:hypothetical protein
MRRQATFYRTFALVACLVWGVIELIALQRARLLRPHDPV